MLFVGKNNEQLLLENINNSNCLILKENIKESLLIIWNIKGNDFIIDEQTYNFQKDSIVCLTEFHKIIPINIQELRLIRFNREFFCINNSNSEISCKGILFFGSQNIPLVYLSEQNNAIFNVIWEMFIIEINNKDDLQYEMLETLLKRILILIMRIYKKEKIIDSKQYSFIKEFNYLVERNFRRIHKVKDYANLMNKTSKYLSSLFNKLEQKTPLSIIQNRLLIQAKRELIYSEQSIKEISFNLGFEDIQSFSRFFKSKEKLSPNIYREKMINKKEKMTTNRR